MSEASVFYSVYILGLLLVSSIVVAILGSMFWVIIDIRAKDLDRRTKLIWISAVILCPVTIFLYFRLRKLPDGLVFNAETTTDTRLKAILKLMPVLSFMSFIYLVYVMWSTGLLRELLY